MRPALAKFLSSSILGALCCAAAPAAWASSTAASSASDSVTTSVGSSSASIKGSSNSSAGTKGVAEGDYRLIELAALDEQPGMLVMTLRAVAEAEAGNARGDAPDVFFLILPQQAVQQARLAPGAVVTARQRPYGVEFSGGADHAAFFLVLDDEWFRELQSRPVVL